MSHLSLYRKYRSQNFDEIVGQDPIITTLKNAIKNQRISHAYLFTGPRGTGKTSTARIFSKAINCSGNTSPNPCGKCDQCIKITKGHALNVIEIDAASNRGIDEIRDLREKIAYKPVEGRYKVYIIDEVHMLTSEAFNALLKTLEEPPADTFFILATTEPQRVPITISSRCQRFDFGRISPDNIAKHIKEISSSEKIKIDEDAINRVARAAEGSLRDALSLIDQLMSYCQGAIKLENVIEVLGTSEPQFLFDFGGAIAEGSEKKILELVDGAVLSGVSIPQLAKDLTYHFRNLLLAKIGSTDILELSKDQIEKLKSDSERFSLGQLKNIIRKLSAAETEMKWHQNSRLVLEVSLLEMCGNVPEMPLVQVKKHEVLQGGSPEVKVEKNLFGEIKDKWNEVLLKMKSKSLFGYVSLHEAEPSGIDHTGRLVLSFKKGYSFHKSRVEEPQNKSILEGFIADIVGKDISIACVLSEKNSEPAPRTGQERITADEVAEMFDGKLVS